MPDQLVASMALWWPLISRFCLSSPSLAATQHWNLTNEDETTGTKGGQCGHWVSFNKKQPLGENKWRMVGMGHPGWLGDELKIENWRYGVTDGDRGTILQKPHAFATSMFQLNGYEFNVTHLQQKKYVKMVVSYDFWFEITYPFDVPKKLRIFPKPSWRLKKWTFHSPSQDTRFVQASLNYPILSFLGAWNPANVW